MTHAAVGLMGWEDSDIPSNSDSWGSMTYHQHAYICRGEQAGQFAESQLNRTCG